MSKGKKVGTVQNSIREEEKLSSEEMNTPQEVQTMAESSSSQKVSFNKTADGAWSLFKPDESDEDKLIKAKNLINNYARKCIQIPDCRSNALEFLFAESIAISGMKEVESKLPPGRIIRDAEKIVDILGKLLKNYLKEHDRANDELNGILSRYSPELEAWLNVKEESINHYLDQKNQ